VISDGTELSGMRMILNGERDFRSSSVWAGTREREITRFKGEKGQRLINRLLNHDFNPPLKGHTPVSSIVLEN
jgi:hypothetical protein